MMVPREPSPPYLRVNTSPDAGAAAAFDGVEMSIDGRVNSMRDGESRNAIAESHASIGEVRQDGISILDGTDCARARAYKTE